MELNRPEVYLQQTCIHTYEIFLLSLSYFPVCSDTYYYCCVLSNPNNPHFVLLSAACALYQGRLAVSNVHIELSSSPPLPALVVPASSLLDQELTVAGSGLEPGSQARLLENISDIIMIERAERAGRRTSQSAEIPGHWPPH